MFSAIVLDGYNNRHTENSLVECQEGKKCWFQSVDDDDDIHWYNQTDARFPQQWWWPLREFAVQCHEYAHAGKIFADCDARNESKKHLHRKH